MDHKKVLHLLMDGAVVTVSCRRKTEVAGRVRYEETTLLYQDKPGMGWEHAFADWLSPDREFHVDVKESWTRYAPEGRKPGEVKLCRCGRELAHDDAPTQPTYRCFYCKVAYDAEENEVRVEPVELAANGCPAKQPKGSIEWARAQAKAGETPRHESYTSTDSWSAYDRDRDKFYWRYAGCSERYYNSLLDSSTFTHKTGWSLYTPEKPSREWLCDRFGEPMVGLKAIRMDGTSRSSYHALVQKLARPFTYVKGTIQHVPKHGAYLSVRGDVSACIKDGRATPLDECQIVFFEGWHKFDSQGMGDIESFEYVHWLPDPCPERLTPELLECVRGAGFLTPEQKAFVLGEPVECKCGKPLDKSPFPDSFECQCGQYYDVDGNDVTATAAEIEAAKEGGSLKWAQQRAKEGQWVDLTGFQGQPFPRRWNPERERYECRDSVGNWSESADLVGSKELTGWSLCPEQPGGEAEAGEVAVCKLWQDAQGRFFHLPGEVIVHEITRIRISSTGSFNCPGYDLVAWGYEHPQTYNIVWEVPYPRHWSEKYGSWASAGMGDCTIYPTKVKLARRVVAERGEE